MIINKMLLLQSSPVHDHHITLILWFGPVAYFKPVWFANAVTLIVLQRASELLAAKDQLPTGLNTVFWQIAGCLLTQLLELWNQPQSLIDLVWASFTVQTGVSELPVRKGHRIKVRRNVSLFTWSGVQPRSAPQERKGWWVFKQFICSEKKNEDYGQSVCSVGMYRKKKTSLYYINTLIVIGYSRPDTVFILAAQ